MHIRAKHRVRRMSAGSFNQAVHATGQWTSSPPDPVTGGFDISAEVTNESTTDSLFVEAVVVGGGVEDVISSQSVFISGGEQANISFNVTEQEIDADDGDYSLALFVEPLLSNDWRVQVDSTPITLALDTGTGGCSTDADCSGTAICQDGECVSVECTADHQCGPNFVCEDNTCVDASACSSNADCPSGKVCVGGQCVDDTTNGGNGGGGNGGNGGNGGTGGGGLSQGQMLALAAGGLGVAYVVSKR